MNPTAHLHYFARAYRLHIVIRWFSPPPPVSCHSKQLAGKMMVDPFEVRMRFTAQLQHLSASVTSSQKAAHYALKYRDLDEDLHSCILEQLERVGAIIVYF